MYVIDSWDTDTCRHLSTYCMCVCIYIYIKNIYIYIYIYVYVYIYIYIYNIYIYIYVMYVRVWISILCARPSGRRGHQTSGWLMQQRLERRRLKLWEDWSWVVQNAPGVWYNGWRMLVRLQAKYPSWDTWQDIAFGSWGHCVCLSCNAGPCVKQMLLTPTAWIASMEHSFSVSREKQQTQLRPEAWSFPCPTALVLVSELASPTKCANCQWWKYKNRALDAENQCWGILD